MAAPPAHEDVSVHIDPGVDRSEKRWAGRGRVDYLVRPAEPKVFVTGPDRNIRKTVMPPTRFVEYDDTDVEIFESLGHTGLIRRPYERGDTARLSHFMREGMIRKLRAAG